MFARQLGGELRHAARALIHRPVFVVAAVLSIAVGAGLNIGVYAVVKHVLFDDPISAAAPDRFLRLEPGISFPAYQELRRHDVPIDLIAIQMNTLTWRSGDVTRTLAAHVVSDNFFATLGVRPILGRAFNATDVGPTLRS
jgi:hypothetical protein